MRPSPVVRIFPLALLLASCDRATSGAGGPSITEAAYAAVVPSAARIDTLSCAADGGASAPCEFIAVQTVSFAGGSTFVVDRGQLERIDDAGVRRPMAGRGAGPGELMAPITISAATADQVWAFDIARLRLIRFSTRDSVAEFMAMMPRHMHEMRLRDGRLHALVLPAAAAYGDIVQAGIVRLTPGDSAWRDSTAHFPEPAISEIGGEGMFRSRLPWDRRRLWDACGDGSVVAASSETWRIERYVDGALVQEIRRDGAPPRVMSNAEHEAVSRDWLERTTSRAPPSVRAEMTERLAVKPDRVPLLDGLFCDDDGAVFVRNASGATDTRWDVLDRSGTLVRSLTVPSALRVHEARAGRLLGVLTNDDGADRVVSVDGAGGRR